MDRIRIATRESELALWQAHFIQDKLITAYPDLTVDIVGMTTAGDRWLDKPLSEIGGKGLFIKELETAILNDEADIAVHSMKDLPAVLPDGFELAAIGYRAEVADTLVGVASIDELPQGASVGSSSLRRQAQLKAKRPDLNVRPIRGNVGTRLSKLAAGDYDAIVLAQAGLDRLGLKPQPSWQIPIAVSLPAAGQGALGVECLADSPVAALVAALNDPEVAVCVQAERGVSAGLGADCSAPLAAYGLRPDGSEDIWLRAKLGSPDGSTMLASEATGTDPDVLADHVVAALYDQGAQSILEQISD